jgi:hypothetical protein
MAIGIKIITPRMFHNILIRIGWLLICVFVVGACGGPMEQVQQKSCAGGNAEFDIFSGQPNPILQVGDSACIAIIAVLQPLAQTAPFEVSEQLGYRGVHISLNEVDHNRKVIYTEIYVFGGQLRVTESGVTRFLADPEHRMEAVLLEQAAQSLDPDTVRLLKEVMK